MANTYNVSQAYCVPSLSCEDSSLSISANIIGIITFAYAWAVGLGFLTRFRNSTGEARSLSESLTSSMREIQLLEPFIKKLETKSHDPHARALSSELSLSAIEALDRLNELEDSLGKRQWLRGEWQVGNGRLRSRTNFVLKQEDLIQMTAEKDRAMGRMRCAMDRSVLISGFWCLKLQHQAVVEFSISPNLRLKPGTSSIRHTNTENSN